MGQRKASTTVAIAATAGRVRVHSLPQRESASAKAGRNKGPKSPAQTAARQESLEKWRDKLESDWRVLQSMTKEAEDALSGVDEKREEAARLREEARVARDEAVAAMAEAQEAREEANADRVLAMMELAQAEEIREAVASGAEVKVLQEKWEELLAGRRELSAQWRELSGMYDEGNDDEPASLTRKGAGRVTIARAMARRKMAENHPLEFLKLVDEILSSPIDWERVTADQRRSARASRRRDQAEYEA